MYSNVNFSYTRQIHTDRLIVLAYRLPLNKRIALGYAENKLKAANTETMPLSYTRNVYE